MTDAIPIPVNSTDTEDTAEHLRTARLSRPLRQMLRRWGRCGVLALLVATVGWQSVRQQAQEQQLAELESAFLVCLPGGLATSLEALDQRMTRQEAALHRLADRH